MAAAASPAAMASGGGSLLGGSAAAAHTPSASAAQFREIHKNTWLKRLTPEGKKVTVGPKKSERTWVVFCVHDDTEAVLEGYAEPRQASSHSPEWIVPLQDALHISHALIPNSHEFEFVVTLSGEVVRFHATSWEIMQEWVETLRSKLREMKILSPRENLYTKLPEVRAPLLPTRDPTSPLPAPPPVPAAIVPGVERVVPSVVAEVEAAPVVTASSSSTAAPATTTTPSLSSMSNTLTQNLLNMLSDPISAYSEQLNGSQDHSTLTSDAEDEEEDGDQGEAHSKKSTSQQSLLDLDQELFAPLLRHSSLVSGPSSFAATSVRVDIGAGSRLSADQVKNFESLMQCERLIPRPQTSRSHSAGAADKSSSQRAVPQTAPTDDAATGSSNDHGITELEVGDHSSENAAAFVPVSCSGLANTTAADPNTNITIIQVSTNGTATAEQPPPAPQLPAKTVTAEVFKFPDTLPTATTTTTKAKQHEYKSNVQIIPSNANASTIKVMGGASAPVSIPLPVHAPVSNQYSTPVKKKPPSCAVAAPGASENQKLTTTVHVAGSEAPTTNATGSSGSAVSVYGTCYAATHNANSTPTAKSTPKLPKKVILTAHSSGVTNIAVNNSPNELVTSAAVAAAASDGDVRQAVGNVHYEKVFLSTSVPVTSTIAIGGEEAKASKEPSVKVAPSPTPLRRRVASPTEVRTPPPQSAARLPMLTRGLTEAVITTRPSRRDFHQLKLTPASKVSKSQTSHQGKAETSACAANNNGDCTTSTNSPVVHPHQALLSRVNCSDVFEQRRRSSSTSDAQAQRSSARHINNNEFPSSRGGVLCIQQPPQPFRSVENGISNPRAVGSPPGNAAKKNHSPGTKRMTLREQQVMQLRREIMHPGGVRLQLRRKDCVGSIAWVDAFGAVWVAGWKQKEHPVLYNALHIGDQLLSIAGMSISSAAEANKFIRNANTLFVEVLVRRIPFGRGYAIRREREGQCLGLIRDGNTSTIVDVVPNSLAARHGLPPKAQSCDGSCLTFWVLTEINGRPLNLFFKEYEIRDRLNSVGRDISILVQPSDLITKLKKQLKSLRGYKDYLVQ